MALFTVVLLLPMAFCSVYATIVSTHFTLQRGKTTEYIPMKLQISCLNKRAIVCAVKCAANPKCLSFSLGKKTIWASKGWESSLPPQKKVTTPRKQQLMNKDACSALPRLQHGEWVMKKKKKVNKDQTVSVICNRRYTSSGHKREILCVKAKLHWQTIDSDCEGGAMTYLGVSTIYNFPYMLKDLRGIALRGKFHQNLTVFLHNSRMPSLKLKFILRFRTAEFILLKGQWISGDYPIPLMNDAPKTGLFMLRFSVRHGYLRFQLSRGVRQVPMSMHGFSNGVDKLVLENPDNVQSVKIYFGF